MLPTPPYYPLYPLQKFTTFSRPQGNAFLPIGMRALSFSAGAIGMTLALGTLIKQLRQKKGLSQRHLAQVCQVSPAYLSLIESGQRVPPEELCVQLAAVLDYDARELAGRAQLVKSPKTAEKLYGSNGGGRDTADSEGNGGDYDPDVERLRRQLRSLRTTMSEQRYSELIESLIKFVATHEVEKQWAGTQEGVEKGQIVSSPEQREERSSSTLGGVEKQRHTRLGTTRRATYSSEQEHMGVPGVMDILPLG
jgi:transcriptional regulator with XRE-family HTH domain